MILDDKCQDCELPENPKEKKDFEVLDMYRGFTNYLSGNDDYARMKGDLVMPFNIQSTNVEEGYTKKVNSYTGLKRGVDIVNLHNDSYGEDNEIPMPIGNLFIHFTATDREFCIKLPNCANPPKLGWLTDSDPLTLEPVNKTK